MDGFTAPVADQTKPTASSGGGFSLDGFSAPTKGSEKIYGYNQQQTMYDKAVADASSFTGLLKNTGKDIVGGTADMVESIASKTWATYQATPGKIMDDIQEAKRSNDVYMANDKGNAGASARDALKMVWKAGGRPALDFANAVFAPLSAALGSIMDKTGGQQLIDKSGNTIVDKSGITDNKAFQQFAVEHPNFGEDFMRLITGFMSAGETGKIDPVKTVSDIGNLASRTIKQAKPDLTPPTQQVTPETPETQTTIPVKSSPDFSVGHGANPIFKSAFEANFKTEPTLGQILTQSGVQPKTPAPEGFDTTGVKPETPAQPVTAPNAPEDVRQTMPDGTKVAKSASDINATLVQKGFEALPPEEQAKYSPGSYKDEASNVANLMDTDMQKATDMATGDAPLEGIKYPQILFNAIEAKATADGDAATLMKLAKSPLSTQLSESGQTLGSHGFNDNPNSPVDAIKAVQQAREDYAAKKASKGTNQKADIIKTGLDEAAKVKPTKQSWGDFVESIKCNY